MRRYIPNPSDWLKGRTWFFRTCQKGQVVIGGKVFAPDNQFMEYDGRLDGLRLCFAIYWEGDKLLGFIYLWGLEEAAKAISSAETEEETHRLANAHWPGPAEVDGYFPWSFWHWKET